MRSYNSQTVPAAFLILVIHGNSHAAEGIYGCWNNIRQVPVDPKYSPMHESTTANGYVLCFGKKGSMTSTSIGGFEALGSKGRYSYKLGHLVAINRNPGPGWPFESEVDHCTTSLTSTQLTIGGCKGWKPSDTPILYKQSQPPDMKGVAASSYK